MQLYALNGEGQVIRARQALKHTDYQCLECRQTVRLRGGPQRQPHFYHLEPTPFCRQHHKGPVHLQIQSYFLQKLPLGDCQLECSFPSIRRIADVAWLSQQIIFEIQCSPISAQEVLARNRDYQQLGWRVVWILHDERYNQTRLSAAELALRSSPHFFTNMDRLGAGMIYDQFDVCDKGLRLRRLPPLPIEIRDFRLMESIQVQSFPFTLLEHRMNNWKLFFAGDLFHLFLNTPSSDYLRQVVEIEKSLEASCLPFTWHHLPFKLWQWGVAIPYQTLFRFLLERMCR